MGRQGQTDAEIMVDQKGDEVGGEEKGRYAKEKLEEGKGEGDECEGL